MAITIICLTNGSVNIMNHETDLQEVEWELGLD